MKENPEETLGKRILHKVLDEMDRQGNYPKVSEIVEWDNNFPEDEEISNLTLKEKLQLLLEEIKDIEEDWSDWWRWKEEEKLQNIEKAIKRHRKKLERRKKTK